MVFRGICGVVLSPNVRDCACVRVFEVIDCPVLLSLRAKEIVVFVSNMRSLIDGNIGGKRCCADFFGLRTPPHERVRRRCRGVVIRCTSAHLKLSSVNSMVLKTSNVRRNVLHPTTWLSGHEFRPIR